jgi:DNA-binding transcriptional MerR regulator
MRIGDLAARARVSVRALRYYEEQGLLLASRSPSGQRHYTDDALDRVHLIQQLYAAGLSSTTILELLPCIDAGVATPMTLDRLTAERDRIDERVRALMAARAQLNEVITAAEHPEQPCRFVSRTVVDMPPTPAAPLRRRR